MRESIDFLLVGVGGQGILTASDIVAEARQHGFIILVAGEKIGRLLPPLTISRAEFDILIERLLNTLETVG